MTPVLIEWDDAHAPVPPGWVDAVEVVPSLRRIRTVGWLLPGPHRGMWTVAQSWDPTGNVDHVVSIPAGCVRRAVYLLEGGRALMPDT